MLVKSTVMLILLYQMARCSYSFMTPASVSPRIRTIGYSNVYCPDVATIQTFTTMFHKRGTR